MNFLSLVSNAGPLLMRLMSGKKPTKEQLLTIVDDLPIAEVKPYIPNVITYMREILLLRMLKPEDSENFEGFSIMFTNHDGVEYAFLVGHSNDISETKAIRHIKLEAFINEQDDQVIKLMIKQAIIDNYERVSEEPGAGAGAGTTEQPKQLGE